jgi:hypothetical protein
LFHFVFQFFFHFLFLFPLCSSLRFTLSPHITSCSVRDSRKARALLSDLIFDHLPVDYRLPSSCPFNTDYDFTAPLEAFREKIRPAVWRCSECEKQFKGENWLDQHLERSHFNRSESSRPANQPKVSDSLISASPRVCLADYCSILDCDHRESSRYQEVKITSKRRDNRQESEENPSLNEIPPCNPKQVERDRLECFNVLSQCFPLVSSSSNSFHSQFSASICGHLTCDQSGTHIGREKLKKSKEKQENSRTKVILMCIFIVAALIYYFFLWIFRGETYENRVFTKSNRSKYEIPWWAVLRKCRKNHERPKLF